MPFQVHRQTHFHAPRFVVKTIQVMKLTAILLLCAILHVSAKSYSQSVTLTEKGATLEKVLKDIRKQTGFQYLFMDQTADQVKGIDLSVREASIEDVLDLCFKDLPLTYSIENKFIIIKRKNRKVSSEPIKSALPLTDIHGKVMDSLGNPLAGASVYIKGTKLGVQTRQDGTFDFKGINAESTLEVSFTGFQNKEMKIGSRSDINIMLSVSNNPLDEAQVVAYGTTTRRLNVGSISTVSSRDIEEQPISNPLEALEGRMTGVYVQQTSGVSGSGFNLQIRGQNTFMYNNGNVNGNLPLYIVDGVPFSASSLDLNTNISGQITNNASPLNAINPADIESITVLKDADATAIYGSRGANGVVLITTKRGKAGKTKVDLNAYSGAGSITRMMNLLNTPQYLQMRNEAFTNDGASPQGYDHDVNGDWDTTRYTNWQKALIGGTAPTTSMQGSLSGGNQNTQFLVGGGYYRQGTVFPGDFADVKASAHFNINHTSENKRLQATFSVSYVADQSNLPASDPTGIALTLPPDAPPVYNANGGLNWANGSWPIGNNPFAFFATSYNGNTNNLIGSSTISYSILPGLTVKTTLGYNNIALSQTNVTPISAQNPAYNPVGSGNYGNSSVNSWIIEPQTEYSRNVNKGKLSFLVGGTFQQTLSQDQSFFATGYTSDALIQDLTAAPSFYASTSDYTQYRYTAGFGRINYLLEDKYILNLTGRRDGSSRFASGKQFGNFGSVGAGWIFSKEKFVSDLLPILSFGKIRASYGVTGNDQIGYYQYLSTYSATQYPYNGITGLTLARLVNPDFGWGTNKKGELGVELGFFKDRILLVADYYYNRSSNQLVSYPLPVITGQSSVEANLPATVENNGYEFQLNAVNVKTPNFIWNTSINLTIPFNKLLSYPNLAGSSNANLYVVGKSLYIRPLFHFLGVNDTTGVYQFQSAQGATPNPTYPNDLQARKQIAQDFYGGMLNSFRYKQLELDILLQFVKQTGPNYLSYFQPPGMQTNQPITALDRWQRPGDDKSIQQFTQAYGGNAYTAYSNLQQSDAILGNASFIRFKNISLSYQLSPVWTSKMKIQVIRIYLHVQNLFTFTKYLGLDPETQSFGSIPPLKIITGGIQITL
jgi:TonB-linked SusC/RagA family outer membrane protein